MSQELIDLRSDTVTLPTDEMREAMKRAEVGDYGRGDDPTMNRLEALAAERMGKEAAIFAPSGTFGNLVCLMAHTHPGDEVILEAEAHIYYYEVGGFASVAGLSCHLVKGRYGVMDPADIEKAIRPPSAFPAFYPTTRLLCIENTHNQHGGNAITPEEMAAMADVARRRDLAIHLDGARIFNAAIALGVDVKELTKYADSVMFCLSKGLSAPVGSMITGSNDFIERARTAWKKLGGGLRQCGVLGAAGILALEHMVDRLAEDHRNAALLAEGLENIPRIVVDIPPNPTNMVCVETTELGIDSAEFLARTRQQGVLGAAYGPSRIKLVTHRHIRREDIERAIEAVRKVAAAV
jgi:threonine aldolase